MKSVLYYKERLYDHIHTVHRPTYYDFLPGRKVHSVLRRRVATPSPNHRDQDPVSILRQDNLSLHLLAGKIKPFKIDLKPMSKHQKGVSLTGKIVEKLSLKKSSITQSPVPEHSKIRSSTPNISAKNTVQISKKTACMVARSQSASRQGVKMIIKISPDKITDEIRITSWEQSPHDLKHIYETYNV